MKSLSIKKFFLFALLTIIVSEGFIFFHFYSHYKKSVSLLLTQNIQNDILSLKHFLDKNLKSNNITNITSQLNNVNVTSNLIEDVRIYDNFHTLLYSDLVKEKESTCPNISTINSSTILDVPCYSFATTLYNGLQPYYFQNEVHINKSFIDNLLAKNLQEQIIPYVLFIFATILLLWLLVKREIVLALEKLRQYAYYNNEAPKKFFIKEIESIRYSLSMTFSRLQEEQNKLYKLSTKDPLSGLYNRLSLMERLQWFVSQHKRSHTSFALLFLDLDNFKNINDSKGHNFGDEVLKHISSTLLEIVRENDIVSRFGGDEFVILLPDVSDEKRVVEFLDRVQKELATPIVFDNFRYTTTASIGITLYPRDGKDGQTLLKHADIAMYKSKELGKNNFHFFTESLNAIVQNKIAMQRKIENALEHKHFELYYQPKVEIKTGRIISCEALIRLNDPIDGLISPDSFIPIAEENNSIIAMGEWIITQATRQVEIWQEDALCQNLKVSINVSAKQFSDKNLLKHIAKETQKIDISKLDIELTESILAKDYDKVLSTLQSLKTLGLTLSLDDFGTGYSSLSYLKNIPYDTIKIDKSFIDDFLVNEKNLSFVKMIINIAKTLHLEVVAEGVETQEQMSKLMELECDMYQGYLCSKPLPAKEFELLVHRTNAS